MLYAWIPYYIIFIAAVGSFLFYTIMFLIILITLYLYIDYIYIVIYIINEFISSLFRRVIDLEFILFMTLLLLNLNIYNIIFSLLSGPLTGIIIFEFALSPVETLYSVGTPTFLLLGVLYYYWFIRPRTIIEYVGPEGGRAIAGRPLKIYIIIVKLGRRRVRLPLKVLVREPLRVFIDSDRLVETDIVLERPGRYRYLVDVDEGTIVRA